jgi:hypothetical protein
MYCSGCGQALAPGQAFCPNCGRPAAPMAPPVAAPPVPLFEIQLESYAGKVRALGILWFVYAGLSLLAGLAGLAFMRAIFFGGFGPWMHPWMHGTPPPTWFFPAIMPFIWILVVLRTGLGRSCRMGPAGTRAVGPHRSHHCGHPQPYKVPLWHRTRHLHPGGAAGVPELPALRASLTGKLLRRFKREQPDNSLRLALPLAVRGTPG